MAMAMFGYVVKANVWTSGGYGRVWQGQVTISQRADSDQGCAELKGAVGQRAQAWLRQQGETPSGKIELKEWRPGTLQSRGHL